ncbi:MAG: hypothetical protein NTZ78_00240 [Candidatus Aureabacteria bacterium]|nr:hypothetical protein [Candidatus Auribacterota bacterium]
MNTSKKAGRPPKFQEARRPVTVTLPMRVLEILNTIDPDRARAIAKLAAAAGRGLRDGKPVEIVEVAPHRGLIVVKESKVLRSIDGLRLIEIAPARFLITLKASLSVESLEVQIHDWLEEGNGNPEEVALLKELFDQLRHHRRRKAVSKEELLIINM